MIHWLVLIMIWKI